MYSPTASSMTSRTMSYNRRFSDASAVLPIDHARQRRDSFTSEETSYTFGKPQQYLGYAPSPGISRAPSFLEDGRQTVMSHLSSLQLDETDDPAVARSVFTPPTRNLPSLQSLPSAARTPAEYRSVQSRSPSLASAYSHSPSLASGASLSPVSPLSVSPLPMPRPTPSPQQQVTLPYTCAFRMSTNGSMVLAPPETFTDLSPLYRIEVCPNVFTPTSYITKVYRGSTTFLGQFEYAMCFVTPVWH